jgi:hypothetical protein
MALVIFGAGSAAGADGDWNNPLNWTGDTLPGSSDEAHFDAASPILTTGPTAYTVDKFTMAVGASYPDGTLEIRNLTVLSEITIRGGCNFILTESDYGTGSATFDINVFDTAALHADRLSDINMNADLTTITVDAAATTPPFSAYAGLGQGALLFLKPAVINAAGPIYSRFKTANTNFPFSTTNSTVYNQVLGKNDWIAQHWTQGSSETINVIRHFLLLDVYDDANGRLLDMQQVRFEIWSTTAGNLDTLLESSLWMDSAEAFLQSNTFGKNIYLQNDLTLSAAGTYALVIKGSQGRIKGAFFTNALDFTSRSSGPSGGKIETSSNAGGSWSLLTSSDFFPMDFEYHINTQINITDNGYLAIDVTAYDWCIVHKIYINGTSANLIYFLNGSIDTTQVIVDFVEIIQTGTGTIGSFTVTGTLQQFNVLNEIKVGGVSQFNSIGDIVGFPTNCVLKFLDQSRYERMAVEGEFSEYPNYVNFKHNSICMAPTLGSVAIYEDDSMNWCVRGNGGDFTQKILFKPKVKGSF